MKDWDRHTRDQVTPFSKIWVGMRIGGQTNVIVIDKQVSSLYSLIADGKYRNTSLGCDMWKTLIGSQASLQPNCNLEGFNAKEGSPCKSRIGILGNDEKQCDSSNSRIGFGSAGSPDESNTSGNVAGWNGDNGQKKIKTMGYCLVQ